MASIYELEGDGPMIELEGDAPTHELEGDAPTSELEGDIPTSPSSMTFSEASLKPHPLNFSRPKTNFSRPRPLHAPLPPPETRGSHQRHDSIDSDSAAPPPVVRTYASSVDLEDLHQIDIRDSIDEAIPPPIRWHSNWTDSAYRPQLASTSETSATSHGAGQAPTRDWIYKPYVNSLSSYRPSLESTTTDATDATDETQDTVESDYITRPGDALDPVHNAMNASVGETRGTTQIIPRSNSSASEITFDGRLGWNLQPQLSSAEAERQRWKSPPTNRSSTTTTSTTTTGTQSLAHSSDRREDSTASSGQPLLPTTTRISTASSSSSASSGAAAAPPPIPARIPRIIKRTSVDQMSEHVNPWQGESMSDRGSISSNEWTSSHGDTSVLSVEKIHKLKKKGINPALYVEMKNARKGKSKWISPLQGNSFLM